MTDAANDSASALLDPGASPRREAPGVRLSRRAWLRGFAGAGAAHAACGAAHATASADPDPSSLLLKLVRRVTYHPTPEELALAAQLGYDGYLERQLNHLALSDAALTAPLARLTTLGMTYAQLLAINNSGQVRNELTEALILRAQLSSRQLFERMVEFWTDHFSVDFTSGDCSLHKTIDDRDVIRPHALGTFPALLQASTRSPAMLVFLDNVSSNRIRPNENYARELLELHTMGVNSGYTQTDVQEVARCFTGWRVRPDSSGPTAGQFYFDAAAHDEGQKVVLGNVIPANGGMADGVRVAQILAEHPATAAFIAGKLTRWLLGEHASASVVRDVAPVYTSTSGDIKAMVRRALRPEHLHDASPKLKRPFHLCASALRAVGGVITSTSRLRTELRLAGHSPYSWKTPDGYPDTFEHWSGLVQPRWNFAATLGNQSLTGVTLDFSVFFAGAAGVDAMMARLNERLFGGEMSPDEFEHVRQYMLPEPTTTSKLRDAVGLALSTPSFQWF
ncbi:MAG: DUF1800 domain-containing protein [Planctomycetota bacterium]|nr:DUF1800 domain-containing protein [Planctomycetota bacterium]